MFTGSCLSFRYCNGIEWDRRESDLLSNNKDMRLELRRGVSWPSACRQREIERDMRLQARYGQSVKMLSLGDLEPTP